MSWEASTLLSSTTVFIARCVHYEDVRLLHLQVPKQSNNNSMVVAVTAMWAPNLLGPGARGVYNLALGSLSLGCLLSLPLLLCSLLLTLQSAFVLHHTLHSLCWCSKATHVNSVIQDAIHLPSVQTCKLQTKFKERCGTHVLLDFGFHSRSSAHKACIIQCPPYGTTQVQQPHRY